MFVDHRARPTVPGQTWIWVPSRSCRGAYRARPCKDEKIILWPWEYCYSSYRPSTVFQHCATFCNFQPVLLSTI